MRELLEYCKRVTDEHLETQPFGMLYVSTVEELGEVARAIKIENRGVGTSCKVLDESAKEECVDLFICGVAIWLSVDKGDINREFKLDRGAGWRATPIYEFLSEATLKVAFAYENRDRGFEIADVAYHMFSILGGTQEELKTIMQAKLDKWNNNLKKSKASG